MNIKTFILYILLTSLSGYSIVYCRSSYENPSYNNDRDENLALLSRQKKRISNEENLHDDQSEEYERSVPVYETQRYRKYDSDGFARHDNRMDKMSNFEEKNRDYYDTNNAKDASIEVILDPRAKKAVAVVENTPNGQAMYDLTAWKNKKEESSGYDSDQYSPGTQEQVVNLVYPAERSDRKYSNSFESNADYSEKSKLGFKDNILTDDSHKRKRNVDAKKLDTETEKRSVQDKAKRKLENKLDVKLNECPPHNTPSTANESNKNNENEKVHTVKRETPQWSQEQLDALKNSLDHVKNNEGEVQNLKNILSSMGLIEQTHQEQKREAVKVDSNVKAVEKREENKELNTNNEKSNTYDEDLNQDNIILKRNGRDVNKKEQEEINAAPQEPKEKLETAENNFEDGIDESFNEKTDVKRSSNDAESENKDEMNTNDEKQARKKRQNAEKNSSKDENTDKDNTTGAVKDENKYDNSKNHAKRESNSDPSSDIRKKKENQESEEEYEKRMESQIQAKIDAIKEKVKREILQEHLKRRYKRNQNVEFENLNTNIRKRRQAKEDSSKSVGSNNAANKEKFAANKEKFAANKEKISNSFESQSKIVRRKRANILPEKQMVYRAYQTDQDEEAEDDSEFDDNGYDGRMYVEKRQVEDENDYYDPVRKLEVDNYLRQYFPEPRNRRSYNEGYGEESNAFHGSRRASKNKSFNNKQNQEEYNSKTYENNDNEYFGSLPQSYNGELNRYKRVKRDNPYK